MPPGRQPDQASHLTWRHAVTAQARPTRPQRALPADVRFPGCAPAIPGTSGLRRPASLDSAGCSPLRLACQAWAHCGIFLPSEASATRPSHSWCLSRKPDAFASAHLSQARASTRRLRWGNTARVRPVAPPWPVLLPRCRAGCQVAVLLRLRWAWPTRHDFGDLGAAGRRTRAKPLARHRLGTQALP